MLLNERLKELRTKNNIQQKDLAEKMNVDTRTFRKYESGELTPKLKTIIALADYFDISLDYLVGRTDDPEINK